MLGDVNKLFVFKSLLTTSNNVLPLHLKQTFLPIISIFTEDEGDGIKSRLPFKIFLTLIKVFKALNINRIETNVELLWNIVFSISFWPLGISKLAKPSKNVKRAWPQQQFVTNKNLTWGKLGIFVGVLFHKEFRQEKDLVITLSKVPRTFDKASKVSKDD